METDKQREESVSKHRREAWGAGPRERGLGRGTWGEESGERDLGRETWGRDMGEGHGGGHGERDMGEGHGGGHGGGTWGRGWGETLRGLQRELGRTLTRALDPGAVRADISVPRHPFVYFVTGPQETNTCSDFTFAVGTVSTRIITVLICSGCSLTALPLCQSQPLRTSRPPAALSGTEPQ